MGALYAYSVEFISYPHNIQSDTYTDFWQIQIKKDLH